MAGVQGFEGQIETLSGPYVGLPFPLYTYGDSDVISMPARFRRRLVGRTLRNDFSLSSR